MLVEVSGVPAGDQAAAHFIVTVGERIKKPVTFKQPYLGILPHRIVIKGGNEDDLTRIQELGLHPKIVIRE